MSPTPTVFQSPTPTVFQSPTPTVFQSPTPTVFQSSMTPTPTVFQSPTPTVFQSPTPTEWIAIPTLSSLIGSEPLPSGVTNASSLETGKIGNSGSTTSQDGNTLVQAEPIQAGAASVSMTPVRTWLGRWHVIWGPDNLVLEIGENGIWGLTDVLQANDPIALSYAYASSGTNEFVLLNTHRGDIIATYLPLTDQLNTQVEGTVLGPFSRFSDTTAYPWTGNRVS